jgi:HemY protein
VLGHLLAAGSAHRLQNRALRDEELRQALAIAGAALGALGRGGRAPARRRMGARRSRCAARAASCSAELPPASPAAPTRCA